MILKSIGCFKFVVAIESLQTRIDGNLDAHVKQSPYFIFKLFMEK